MRRLLFCLHNCARYCRCKSTNAAPTFTTLLYISSLQALNTGESTRKTGNLLLCQNPKCRWRVKYISYPFSTRPSFIFKFDVINNMDVRSNYRLRVKLWNNHALVIKMMHMSFFSLAKLNKYSKPSFQTLFCSFIKTG